MGQKKLQWKKKFINVTVNLGEVNVLETITEKQWKKLKAILYKSKLEFMNDKKTI